jgi:integrase
MCLATATLARLRPLRLAMRSKVWRSGPPPRAAFCAASTSAQRSARDPILEIRPSLALPSELLTVGVSPAQAQTEIRRRDVQDLADRMLAKGFSASSVHNVIAPLQAIYRRGLQRELVAENPTASLDLPSKDGRRERIADREEAARLLRALPESERALWATAFYAGLRRGELRALRWSDVDLGRSEIRVQRSWDYKEGPIEPKSKASIRTVPILAVLRDYLDQHKLSTGRDGSDLVFGRKDSEPFCLRRSAIEH